MAALVKRTGQRAQNCASFVDKRQSFAFDEAIFARDGFVENNGFAARQFALKTNMNRSYPRFGRIFNVEFKAEFFGRVVGLCEGGQGAKERAKEREKFFHIAQLKTSDTVQGFN